jgi:EmrB/QacA subfamily drug resistance transporter
MSGLRAPWRVLLVLCLGQSMAVMDTTAVNVAIPSIINGLGAGLDQILWVINSYTLTYAVLLVTGGRLGDLYGQKRLFLVGLGTFITASALCGLARDPSQLIVARLCQGVGGALLTPQVLAIVSHIFPPDRRGAALGVWGGFVSGAAAIGPTLGGLIVTSLGWRWVFYINLPIGLAAMLLCWLVVPDLRRGRRPSLDLVGTAVLTAALALVVFALIEGPGRAWDRIWGPVPAPAFLAAGMALLVLFGHVERSRQDRDPLVPFVVLRQRNFSLMLAVIATLPCALGAMLLLTTIYLQSGIGMSPLTAGLTIASAPLTAMVCSPIGGWLTSRYGGKYVMLAGFLLWAAGIGCLALLARPDAGWPDAVPGLVISGVGMGFVFSPPATIAMRDVEPALSGAASGLLNMTRLSGGLIGVASVGAVLQARMAISGVTDAVRFTYLVPIAVLLAGALGGLAVRTGTEKPLPATQEDLVAKR